MQTQQRALPPLSDELIAEISFAMEDQNTNYVLDLQTGVLVALEQLTPAQKQQSKRYVPLPRWTSAQGYRTMEQFVASLKNEHYKTLLTKALQAGSGVFRLFKDTVKTSAAIEQLWHTFKEKELKEAVLKWYNTESDSFYYSSLAEEIEDPIRSMLAEDFTIVVEAGPYKEEMRALAKQFAFEDEHQNYYVGSRLKELIRESDQDRYIVAIDSANELAGWLTYHLISETIHIRFAYVQEEYRGLGLFHYLLDFLNQKAVTISASSVLMELVGEAIKIEPLFHEKKAQILSKTVIYSLTPKGDEK